MVVTGRSYCVRSHRVVAQVSFWLSWLSLILYLSFPPIVRCYCLYQEELVATLSWEVVTAILACSPVDSFSKHYLLVKVSKLHSFALDYACLSCLVAPGCSCLLHSGPPVHD